MEPLEQVVHDARVGVNMRHENNRTHQLCDTKEPIASNASIRYFTCISLSTDSEAISFSH